MQSTANTYWVIIIIYSTVNKQAWKANYCETVINTPYGNSYLHGGTHITTKKYCIACLEGGYSTSETIVWSYSIANISLKICFMQSSFVAQKTKTICEQTYTACLRSPHIQEVSSIYSHDGLLVWPIILLSVYQMRFQHFLTCGFMG
jgi:hypothetical protein